MKLIRAGAAFIVILTAITGCTSDPAPIAPDNKCVFGHLTDYPVTFHGKGLPVITINIGGHDERMMVDSGAAESFLTEDAYVAMHKFFLDTNFTDIESYGIVGRIEIRKQSALDMQMGHVTLTHQNFLISGKMISARTGDAGIDGVIGNNILDQLDEAYDFPDKTIGFYSTLHCSTPQTPWLGDYAVIPIKYADNGSAGIPYLIDDHSFFGIIDTGTEKTFVTKQALDHAGIAPEAPHAIRAGVIGYGGFELASSIEQFETVAIGAELYRDSGLLVGETPIAKSFDVIIGDDFLAGHRVFIDNYNGNAYLGVSIPTRMLRQ